VTLMPYSQYQPSAFISYSHKEESASERSLRRELIRVLHDNGLKVLIDENIQSGERWTGVLDHWIWNCDAAVLLLSAAALRSKWVLREVTTLMDRWKTRDESGFVFIPIWFPTVTEREVQEEWSPVDLATVQCVKVSDDSDLSELARNVASRLIEVRERRSGRHDIESHLIHLLAQRCTETILRELAARLGSFAVGPGAKQDCAIMLARRLLTCSEPLGVARFDRLASIVETLVDCIDAEYTRLLINRVTPFCWVDADASRELKRIADRSEQERSVAWGRRWCLSERMYLTHAYLRRLTFIVEIGTEWGGGAEEFHEHVRSCLIDELNLGRDASDNALRIQIAKQAKSTDPVFALVPLASIDADLAEQLATKWPGLVIIYHEAGLTKSALSMRGLQNIEFLSPELAPEIEDQARVEWGKLMKAAGVSKESLKNGSAFVL
jgi:hypothetical protein